MNRSNHPSYIETVWPGFTRRSGKSREEEEEKMDRQERKRTQSKEHGLQEKRKRQELITFAQVSAEMTEQNQKHRLLSPRFTKGKKKKKKKRRICDILSRTKNTRAREGGRDGAVLS